MSNMSIMSTVLLVIGTITGVGAFMFSTYKIAKRVDQASCQTEIKAEMGIIKDLLFATVEKTKKTRVRKAS